MYTLEKIDLFICNRQDIEALSMSVTYCVDESRTKSAKYSLNWCLSWYFGCCFGCLIVAFSLIVFLIIACRFSSLRLAFLCIINLILLALVAFIWRLAFFLIDFLQLLLCNFLELFRSSIDLLEEIRNSLMSDIKSRRMLDFDGSDHEEKANHKEDNVLHCR